MEQEKMYFIVFPQTFTLEFSTGADLKYLLDPESFLTPSFFYALCGTQGVSARFPHWECFERLSWGGSVMPRVE